MTMERRGTDFSPRIHSYQSHQAIEQPWKQQGKNCTRNHVPCVLPTSTSEGKCPVMVSPTSQFVLPLFLSFLCKILLVFSRPRAKTRGRPRVPTLSIDTTKGFINQWKINKSYKVVSTLRYHQGTELMLFAHHHPHFSVKKNSSA